MFSCLQLSNPVIIVPSWEETITGIRDNLNSAFLSRWYFPFSKGGDMWKLHMFFPQPWRLKKTFRPRFSALFWHQEGFSWCTFRCCWRLVSMCCWNTFAASRRVLRFQSFNDALKCLFLNKSLGSITNPMKGKISKFTHDLGWWRNFLIQKRSRTTWFPGVNWIFVSFQRLQVKFEMILKKKECFSLRKTHLQCQAYIIQRGVFLLVFCDQDKIACWGMVY